MVSAVAKSLESGGLTTGCFTPPDPVFTIQVQVTPSLFPRSPNTLTGSSELLSCLDPQSILLDLISAPPGSNSAPGNPQTSSIGVMNKVAIAACQVWCLRGNRDARSKRKLSLPQSHCHLIWLLSLDSVLKELCLLPITNVHYTPLKQSPGLFENFICLGKVS